MATISLTRPFIISRTFNAPRERVWKAWTDREQLMQWFGPKGFAMTTAKLDLRPGGMFHYCLRSPFDSSHDGMNQGWTGTFDQLAAYLAKT